MILIATGVNELIAPSVLPFVPLCVYLAAVALVVLFDGPLAGAVAAILAVEAYSLLHTPRDARLSIAVPITLGVAAATVLAGALLRGLLRVRLRSEERPQIFTASPPLLETSIVASDTEAELLAEIEDLRAELRLARENAAATPAQSEDPNHAWELAETLRARDEDVAALQHRLDNASSAHAADRLTLAVELDRLRTSLEHERAIAEKRANVQLDLDDAREEIALLRARITDLESRSEINALQHSLDLERARAEGEKTLREHAEAETAAVRAKIDGIESAFNEKLQTIVAHLASDHELDVGQAMVEKEEARAEARALQARVETLQKKVDEMEKTKPPRILVAHPDEDLRRNAQASLERAGYHVVTAADGLEALKLAASEQPDVVIADAVMPKMNGRELCQLLKSHERTAHIRVLLLLRAIDETPKGDLVPDDVLRKPVPFEKLRSTLAALLQSEERRRPGG